MSVTPPADPMAAMRGMLEALARSDWDGVEGAAGIVLAARLGAEPTGEALLLRGVARQASGDIAGGMGDGIAAFEAWAAADRSWLAARLIGLAGLLAAADEATTLRRYVDLAVTAARQALSGQSAAEVMAAAGAVLAAGHLEAEARDMWEQSLDLHPPGPPLALVNLARLALDAEDYGTVLRRLDECLRATSDANIVAQAVGVALDMCSSLNRAGELAAASAALDRVAARVTDSSAPLLHTARAAVEHDLGLLAIQAGEFENAAVHFEEAVGSGGNPSVTASSLLALALIDCQFARPAVALERVRSAATAGGDAKQRLAAAHLAARTVAPSAEQLGDDATRSSALQLASELYRDAGRQDLASDLVRH